MSSLNNPKHITIWGATCVVIANIIGTGVFTSLGFQAAALSSDVSIMLLWVFGALIAFCGGVTYAELGSALPRSGGEYHFLRELYHPALGFLSGWVSGTVAFAAPTALAALAFGEYVGGAFPGMAAKSWAALALIYVSGMQMISLKGSDRLQSWSTIIKILPILFFIVAGFIFPMGRPLQLSPKAEDVSLVLSPAFAVSLVYVSYAYSGWNASTYIASEVKNSFRTIPLSIFLGTIIVSIIYIILNGIFLKVIPMNELKGALQIGVLAGEKMFGSLGQKTMGVFIGLGLISTMSSMLMAGSRVLKAIGEDYPPIDFLARGKSGNPRVAIVIQTVLAFVMLLTSTFDHVLTYIGFILTIFTTLTVLGVFRLRQKVISHSHYKTWGYPVTPIIFITFNISMMFFLLTKKPFESIAGLLTVAMGYVVYSLVNKKNKRGESL